MSEDEVLASIEELYDQLPTVECQGLCWNSCGPITMSAAELRRIRAAGVAMPEHLPPNASRRWAAGDMSLQCPALVDHRCSVYEVRPLICRAWGAGRNQLACLHGCKVTGTRIKSLDLMRVLNQTFRLGGDNSGYGYMDEDIEAAVLADPVASGLLLRFIDGEQGLEPWLSAEILRVRVEMEEKNDRTS